MIAVEVAKMLAGASGASDSAGSGAASSGTFVAPSGKTVEMVPARAMLDQMGVRLDW